jgi:hypothetical protein
LSILKILKSVLDMKKYIKKGLGIVFTCFYFLNLSTINAQHLPCGHKTTNEDQEFLRTISNKISLKRIEATPITYFPIQAFIVQTSGGVVANSPLQILKGITTLNENFLPAQIQFYLTGPIKFIVSDRFFDFKESQEDSLCKTNDNPNAINIYYVNSILYGDGRTVAGYAYYPSSSKQRVLMQGTAANSIKTLTHELGHYFSLAHTFQDSDNEVVAKRELVTRGTGKNCNTTADFICDTPADPYPVEKGEVTNCVYSAISYDANGDLFSPDILNIMSNYFYFACGTYHFTPTQYDFIRSTATIPNRTKLNTPAQNVPAPSNLVATNIEGGVNLKWQDNATNEIGYFIEHSLYPDSGFVCLNVVNIDSTQYNDYRVEPNTVYYFRVRAANSLNYSTVLSFKTDVLYCKPIYSTTCSGFSPETSINSFTMTTSPVFSNLNNGCSSFTLFSKTPIELQSESNYSFTISLDGTSSYYSQHVAIWIDINKNGVFDVAEKLFATTSSTAKSSKITGSITLPKLATSIQTRMRVRTVSYSRGEVTDPCASLSNGETEDYLVTITGSELGLEDESKISGLAFYPNPSEGTIYIRERLKLVEVLDMTGLVVFSIKPETKEAIDLNNLNNGAYLLRTTDFENKSSFNKLIIEK